MLAAQLGAPHSVVGLHLAVARLEGLRGHCVDAHRHLEIARRFCGPLSEIATQCSIELVEASLEVVAGNLARAKRLAETCFRQADSVGFNKYIAGSLTNLAVIALYQGHPTKSEVLLAMF